MIKYTDMIEGKEYRYKKCLYKKCDGVLYWKYGLAWVITDATMRKIAVEMEFEEIPWEPEHGKRYFFPLFIHPEGYAGSSWQNDGYDNRIKDVVGIYETPEQAQTKARQLGWLK